MSATEIQKQVAITSMELFDPRSRDVIQEIPLSATENLRLRIVALPDPVMAAIEATRSAFIRGLRTKFLAEADEGVRALRMVDDFLDVRIQFEMLSLAELQQQWNDLWGLGNPSVEEEQKCPEPDRATWIESDYLDSIMCMLLVETLLQSERQVSIGVASQVLVNVGQEKTARELTPEELAERVRVLVEQELNEKRLLMRTLSMEVLLKRLKYASAMEPAIQFGQSHTLSIVLYASARQIDDRTKFFYDLSGNGIKTISDALRDPEKAYAAMVEQFQGDEATLTRVSEAVSFFSAPPSANVMERAAEEPFRSESMRPSEEAG